MKDIEDIDDIDARIFSQIRDERGRQLEKWGEQRHSWPEWMSVLGEEYGEACEASNKIHWMEMPVEVLAAKSIYMQRLDALRTELIQTAAVAVAIVEHIDEVLNEL